ncbi:hypothetical protein R1521_32790 [Rhizobium brockwellii]|uniref:Uncharacterized protein n=1 Tax=Rhizobium brockwellii TaxID=3019932 RepID=A0ABU3YWS8_9HYPH|nr:hypothetical protein [Rhizobium brockwellii]MDV4183280.1 hypothetical protein [Rhizobium brockwellii]MDV4190291.1 hypothetical protein [Rhizobium brockwellii]
MSRSPNSPNIHKVARECGVVLRDWQYHSPTSRRARECFCKPTVREIGRRHGEDHLRLVLMLITGSSINAAELYADVLKAVSRLLIANPELVRRPSLVSDFNNVDLGALRRGARSMKYGMATSDEILVALRMQFGLWPYRGEAA